MYSSYLSKLFVFLLLGFVGLTSCTGNKSEHRLSIMSFNIRYDNPNDAPHDWGRRKDSVAALINTYGADLVGTQEVLHHQLEDLQERLKDYKYFGVGRLDGKEAGEYAALWYKAERFQEEDGGYFWLSETPEIAGSMGWDAACERIATWLKLKDKQSGKTFFIVNTHMDHEGQVARQEGIKLICSRIAQLAEGLPLILMGDFNAPPSDDVYALATKKQGSIELYDSRMQVKERLGMEGTFHDFGRISPSERPRIDYIFVSSNFSTQKHEHISTDNPQLCISDHSAVYTELSF